MNAPQTRSRRLLPISTLMMLATCASTQGFAQEQTQETGWYVGGSFGQTETEFRDARMVSALNGLSFTTNSLNLDDEDTGWKVLGGYSFNKWLALEGSYVDLGEFSALANLTPASQQFGEASMSGMGLDLVGTLPLTARFAAFARAGLANMKVEQEFNPTRGTYFTNSSDRDYHEKYGLGLEYRLTDNFALRTEYERYTIDDNRITDNHVDMMSIGVVFRFGRAPAPAPVAETPPPAPAPAPAPTPPPEPMRVTLDAETLFDFDRAELRPAGRTELDTLLRDLRGVDYEVVLVTGHTDRIGTEQYNQGLSERRANAVRDYLVAGGVPSASVTARGAGENEPVTTPQQCQGRRGQDLIACYQPDRRVDVEVNGIREP
ncbi:MAG: OmpA family protein [Pseudomonadota bacterium]|nr:OmpA family protein [Pseudomonadota bacterium]